MHVCVIGQGASGLMVATALKTLDFITKVTVIGSKKIPTIGVGESTTYGFHRFLKRYANVEDFVRESDAALKYGVLYSGWSDKEFLHGCFLDTPFERYGISQKEWASLLVNRPPDISFHDYFLRSWKSLADKNHVLLDENEYGHTWHFVASKLINYLKSLCKLSEKVEFVSDTVDNVEYHGDVIQSIHLESGITITADYYVNASGTKTNVFDEKLDSLSDYLLTDKAVVYPIKYTNKREQFHPYTVAKTMKYGWRWITPTWSRIGTGYVYSSRHVSDDEAVDEFKKDIGDDTINPTIVEFCPTRNLQKFKYNSCAIGMSSGFLEPLDAPGLSATEASIEMLIDVLKRERDDTYQSHLNKLNKMMDVGWWLPFILSQYKTSNREDTEFWKDQKNVNCPQYNSIVDMMNNIDYDVLSYYEWEMMFKTTSAKDVGWNSTTEALPFPVSGKTEPSVHHLDYIQQIRTRT